MKTEITNVSDTALWVATYRAHESKREDALFRDPLAESLAGEKGERIARSMKGSAYVSWSVIIRTYIIDAYILHLVSQGIDTVINLGAGLDTRPYRMNLPHSLHWIEVDFPHLIQMKEDHLREQKPHCHLERIPLDLSDRKARTQLFSRIQLQSKKILVLTEGVIPYLTEEQVAQLAEDIRLQDHFQFWIVDYYSPRMMQYMTNRRMKQLRNAPLQFRPSDWFSFFKDHGWQPKEIQYLGEVGDQIGRSMPTPWFFKIILFCIPAKRRSEHKQYLAYALLQPY